MKTQASFMEEIKIAFNGDFTVVGEYLGSAKHVKVRHNICGHVYDVFPGNLLHHKKGCPNCFALHRKAWNRLTQDQFVDRLLESHQGTIALLGDYNGMCTKTRFLHIPCGHEWDALPSNIAGSVAHGCPICSNATAGVLKRNTHEHFVSSVRALAGDEYTVLGQYVMRKQNVLMRHNVCGHTYDVRPGNFMSGKRCPRCLESKGERAIADILTSSHVSFRQQVTFKDCINIRKLPFDFAILNSENEIVTLVEYDGFQHVQPVTLYGGEAGFERRKLNDKIKNDYCAANNIPLLRIPYTEFSNIETILDSLLLPTVHIALNTL